MKVVYQRWSPRAGTHSAEFTSSKMNTISAADAHWDRNLQNHIIGYELLLENDIGNQKKPTKSKAYQILMKLPNLALLEI